MRLKELRISRKLKQNEMLETVQAIEPRIDVATYSRIENNVVLPTPPVLAAICGKLDATPGQIYDKAEVNLAGCLGATKAVNRPASQRGQDAPKVTFRLNEAACKSLQVGRLARLGYRHKTDWFYAMLRRTDAEYEALVAREGEGV